MEASEEQKKKLLSTTISVMKKTLEKKKQNILAAKEEVSKKNDMCIKAMAVKKEELLKKIDELSENASSHIEETNRNIAADLAAINDKLNTLENAENTNNKDSIESLRNYCQQVAAGTTSYKYLHYETSTEDVAKLCGTIVSRETTGQQQQQQQTDTMKTMTISQQTNVSNRTANLKCKGK